MRIGNSRHGLEQFVNPLVRFEPPAEQDHKIFRIKSQRTAQSGICRAGNKAGRINTVVQNIGVAAVERTRLQIIIPDKFTQCQDAAVDGIHLVAAGGLTMKMRQTPPLAEHPADCAALGQRAALRHNEVRRRQFERKRKLNLLIPWIIRGRHAETPLHKDHRPVPPHTFGPGNIEHFGMTQLLRLSNGLRVRDTCAEQIELAAALIFLNQMGDKRLHSTALHSGYRQFGRGNQQNARTMRRIGGEQRQNGHPFSDTEIAKFQDCLDGHRLSAGIMAQRAAESFSVIFI